MNSIRNTLAPITELLQAGDFKEAAELCREIIENFPRHADAWHLQGVIFSRLRKYESAIESFDRSITLDPRNSNCLNNLGEVYRLLGREEQAVACYRRALQINRDDEEIYNNLGKAFKAQGKLEEAARNYRRALKINPDFSEVYNNLGNVLLNQGKIDDAINAYQSCINLNPSFAQAWNNMAIALAEQNKNREAVTCYEQALQLDPDFVQALNNLGLALTSLGNSDRADDCFQQALARRPDYVETYLNIGNVYKNEGNLKEAISVYQQALRIQPESALVHNSLGIIFTMQCRLEEAVFSFKNSLRLDPEFVEAWNNLGIVLAELCRWDVAIDAFQRAIAIQPGSAQAHANLGLALTFQGKLTEALDSFDHALALKPDYANALHNLAVALKDQGRLDESLKAFQQAITIDPDNRTLRGARLMTMHYSPDLSAETLLAEATSWSGQRAQTTSPISLTSLSADPQKRLRIGYVSADFRRHPVGYLIEPVIPAHNRSEVEVYCYANQVLSDELTDKFLQAADQWRWVANYSDEELANLIRTDAIDILIDLSGHTDKNRLEVFFRKPAPIQATWLGYFSTTGLNAIDYLIADNSVVPPSEERFHVEKIVRLPHSWFCYIPPDYDVDIPDLPACSLGQVTFGSCNNVTKITPEVVSLWSEILRAVPCSRLFLKSKALGDTGTRAHYEKQFAQNGIPEHRLTLEGHSSRQQMHVALGAVDICLDPFPFNGATTTAEALWMGGPVISLRGKDRFVSHMGESILTTVGLTECLADSKKEYVAKAVELASDIFRLSGLRKRIRPQLLASPLCDVERFTQNLEQAYRTMWTAWCEEQGTIIE